VKVSEVTFSEFEGTSGDEKAIVLNCDSSSCSNIVLDHINIASSQTGKPASCSCTNAYGRTTSTIPNCSCLSK